MMHTHQLYFSNLPGPNDCRVGVGVNHSSATSLTHPLIDGDGGAQAQAPHKSRNSHPSTHVSEPLGTGSTSGVHHHSFEGNRYKSHPGPTSLCLPAPTTWHLEFGSHDQENLAIVEAGPEAHVVVSGVPQRTAGSDRGTFHATTRFEDGNWCHGEGRLTLAKFHAVQHGWSDLMDVQQFVNTWNWRSTSPSQGHSTLTPFDNRVSPSSDQPCQNGATLVHASHTSYHNNYLEHDLYPMGDKNRAPGRPNGDAIDSPCYLWSPGAPSSVEDGRDPAESSSPPTGILHSGTDRTAREAVGQGGIALIQKRARVESGTRRDSTCLEVRPGTPVSGPFKMIKQTTYKCPTRQGDWDRRQSIEFGWLKLTDALDKQYRDIPGHNVKPLDYEGVGGSIICRLEFSHCEIGMSKIYTTNHRSDPEPIDKKMLAFKIAKFVERNIEVIGAQEGCRNVTFESIVLRKLHHVSKASWQPEIWYEFATAGRNQWQ